MKAAYIGRLFILVKLHKNISYVCIIWHIDFLEYSDYNKAIKNRNEHKRTDDIKWNITEEKNVPQIPIIAKTNHAGLVKTPAAVVRGQENLNPLTAGKRKRLLLEVTENMPKATKLSIVLNIWRKKEDENKNQKKNLLYDIIYKLFYITGFSWQLWNRIHNY